jgi:hypothetical protein
LDAISDNTCNACSLLWYPFPFLHPPGNFWTAQSSYVAKLSPPRQYTATLQAFLFSKTAGKSTFSNFSFFMSQGDKVISERLFKISQLPLVLVLSLRRTGLDRTPK